MPLTNPPFMQQPGQPPLHFRKLTPEEFAQWTRMRDTAERLLKQPTGGQDDVRTNRKDQR